MVVQSTNTGGDLSNNHFDILMPGGGVGIFDGCTPQFGGLPGARYGGISSKSECNSFPELLKDGCNWRFDWFKNADNPDFTFEQVQCPKALTDISGCTRNDDKNFPVFNGAGSGGSSGGSGSGSGTKTTTKAVTVTVKPTTAKTSKVSTPTNSSGKTVAIYGQCNGDKSAYPNGALPCASGTTCKYQNPWYSQCLP